MPVIAYLMDFFCWRTRKSETFHLVFHPKREGKVSAADSSNERAPLRCNKKYPHGFPFHARRTQRFAYRRGRKKGKFFVFPQKFNGNFLFLFYFSSLMLLLYSFLLANKAVNFEIKISISSPGIKWLHYYFLLFHR